MKPSYFKNELLATSDPLYGWVFSGLWCLADRAGRLEDRPRKIHLEINAGRAYEGTEQSLTWLCENGFIVRYTHGSLALLQIVNFEKHQHPHVKEPESRLPGASTVPAPDLPGANPPSFLTPDSSTSGRADNDSRGSAETPRAEKKAARLPDDFELTPERRIVAEAEKLPADRLFKKFCNYWRAKSGANARKLDWDATWRNWCMTEADRNGGSGNGTGKQVHQPRPSAVERVKRATEAWLNERDEASGGGVVVDG